MYAISQHLCLGILPVSHCPDMMLLLLVWRRRGLSCLGAWLVYLSVIRHQCALLWGQRGRFLTSWMLTWGSLPWELTDMQVKTAGRGRIAWWLALGYMFGMNHAHSEWLHDFMAEIMLLGIFPASHCPDVMLPLFGWRRWGLSCLGMWLVFLSVIHLHCCGVEGVDSRLHEC